MRSFLGAYFSPRTRNAIGVAIACVLAVQFFGWLGWLQGIERGTQDALFRFRSQRYPSPDIVLITVDENTVRHLRRWPLPRRVYAEAVRRLVRAGAKTIAFDVLFSTPASESDDQQLAREVAASGRVVNAVAFNVNAAYNPMQPVDARVGGSNLSHRFAITNAGAGARDSDWATTPFDSLLKATKSVGHINIHPESDGAVRRVPYLVRYYDELYPSLALATAAHFMDIPLRNVVAAPDGVHLAGRHYPIDFHGEAWINWTGANNTFPTFSLTQLLHDDSYRNLLQEEVFRDRVVLIGVTALGAFEHRATPFSPLQPSIEIQANALDNLLQSRPLRDLSALSKLYLLLGFPLLVALLVAPREAVGGTISAGVLGVLLWLFAAYAMSKDLYLPVGAPLLSGALAFVVLTTLNYRREWETNWRTEAAINAIARGGALVASGHDRGRLAEVICETARDALNVGHVLLVMNTSKRDGAMRALLEFMSSERVPVQWPATNSRKTAHSPELDEICRQVCVQALEPERATKGTEQAGAGYSLLAVPLVVDESTENAREGRYTGALIAIEQKQSNRDQREFSERDLALLQTLSEQASLALVNLGYYEQLHGRVEAANQELQDAYNVLVEQSTRFIAAVESIDNALIITDEAMRAIYVNAACREILQEATPELGDVVPQVFASHGMADIANLFENVQANQSVKALCEVGEVGRGSWPREDGRAEGAARHQSLLAQLTPLGTDGNDIPGVMLVVADVTAQRELDTMKTDFVAFVAHELRNPLGSILGYSSLMEMAGDQLALDQRTEMAGAISRQCHRLNRMINDLLDVARLDAGRSLDLRITTFDIAALCRKVVESQKTTTPGAQHIDFAVDDREPVAIQADADRLEQVLTNLVSNAIKYSPEGGTVAVGVVEEPEKVTVNVSDTGLGMTPDQLGNLFQKFYRTPESQARGIKGTGLGLYLVKQLVEAHGGTIEVESKHGAGTTFRVTLPRVSRAGALASDGNSSL